MKSRARQLSRRLRPSQTRSAPLIETSDEFERALAENQYVSNRGSNTAIFVALRLDKPLFLEGEADVGKTELAEVLVRMLDERLIQL